MLLLRAEEESSLPLRSLCVVRRRRRRRLSLARRGSWSGREK